MAYLGPPPSQKLATPTSQYFSGNGSATAFTLNRPVNVAEDLNVFVNNVAQQPGAGKSYTATGTTLTFDAAPDAGTNNVYVVYRGLAEPTTRLEHPSGQPIAATTGTFSGAVTAASTASIAGHAAVGANIVASTRALSVAGATDGSGSEIINCFNSSLASKFSVRDDGLTTVAGNATIDQGSNSGNTLSLDRTSASGSLGLFYNGTQGGLIDTPSNGGFNFYVGSTPALMMSVNNIGSMELGNRSYGSGGYGTVLTLRYAGGGTQYGINFLPDANSAQACSFFNASGSHVGAITVNASATVFSTSSDYRLKENVTADWDATTRLKQLNPVRFNFIADADTTVDGFLAHEVQDIVPEAISGTHDEVDDDGNAVMQGIDQSKLVPLLVKTILELEARITALEA